MLSHRRRYVPAGHLAASLTNAPVISNASHSSQRPTSVSRYEFDNKMLEAVPGNLIKSSLQTKPLGNESSGVGCHQNSLQNRPFG